jgi:hypothetical protein
MMPMKIAVPTEKIAWHENRHHPDDDRQHAGQAQRLPALPQLLLKLGGSASASGVLILGLPSVAWRAL